MMFAMPAWPIVAVLDTNVVIAGLLWQGPPRSLLAGYIVTGDRAHLLPIGMHGTIAIISPRQCLDLLGS